jgi:hypothetical protein
MTQDTSKIDGLISGLQRYRSLCRAEGMDDPFSLPFPGLTGVVPMDLAKKFPGLDAVFGATISISLASQYASRIGPLAAGLSLCESPIEARFLLALVCTCAMNDQALSIHDTKEAEVFGCSGAHGDSVLIIRPQAVIGKQRVDFALTLTFTNPLRAMAKMCGEQEPQYLSERVNVMLAIECDGHQFHEKTPEQAKCDKNRDRNLITSGYPVMRFTGSEIYADPLRCSEQVVREFFGINNDSE